MNIQAKPPVRLAGASDKLKIGFILARSFTLSAFALFADTLRLASDELDRSGRVLADWQVLASSRNLVTSSCGIQVAPTAGLVDPTQFDYLVVVGGLLSVEEPVDRATVEYLKRAAAAKVSLIGLCTGTFILAEAGLMKRHRCCVSWLHVRAFQELFPDHDVRSDSIFNLDQHRGSCAGGSSSADLAASIVRRFISKAAERNALEVLQIDHARPPLHVQPRRPLVEDYADPRINAVLINMERNLDGRLTIKDIAAGLGLSRRQLERVFMEKAGMSPAQAYLRVRLSHAKSMVTQTRASMLDVALEVGFENASHFSRVFKRVYGKTPSAVRLQPI